jgi:hypothetical protein
MNEELSEVAYILKSEPPSLQQGNFIEFPFSQKLPGRKNIITLL